ncbi:PREDICTED: F-box protein At5g03970-like [Camelina sativa]|uniref:F-box protein At5g03970-like n=1 Tax=Camelina sativa TaxID=90675 RepID=A0ABM0VYQ1_CAMSA|nr:PREDICTED: F-box protein At5g03970-like [Camelina sativa]
MSSSIREKNNSGMISDLSAHEVLNSDDAMFEILLLLLPETIYKVILVSKRWLQIVSNPVFRNTYLTKWKPRFHLIGFFISNTMYLNSQCILPRSEPRMPLLSTSIIGNEMEYSNVLKKLSYYIDSSNGLLLCGCHPKTYYLWDVNTRNHDETPCPQAHFSEFVMSLMTEDSLDKGLSYKVIHAECNSYVLNNKKVKVQTYSSKSSMWSYVELTCPQEISLRSWTPGSVIGSVVYWIATASQEAIYGTYDEEKRINQIKLPKIFDYDEQVFGESVDGSLQYGWSDKAVMEIWKLEKVTLQWVLQYKLRFKAMWKMNPVESKRFSKTKETQLLTFMNQNSNSVYIRKDPHIFTCDFESQLVECLPHHGHASSFVWEYCKVWPYFRPIWPSLPLSIEDWLFNINEYQIHSPYQPSVLVIDHDDEPQAQCNQVDLIELSDDDHDDESQTPLSQVDII